MTAFGLSVCLGVFPAAFPDAPAKEKKRHRSQGTGAVPSPDTAEDRQDENDERKRQPDETPEQRRARQLRALRGKDRAAIRTVLGELHAEESADARTALIDYAKRTRNVTLKSEALLALAWRGNRSALAFLESKHGLASSRASIVGAACRAIGKVGDPARKPLLLSRVTSKEPAIAAGALAGLVALDRRAKDLPALIEIGTEHVAPEVRVEAARGLGRVKSDVWRDPLVELARDDAPAVRIAACEALARRTDEASIPLLMQLQTADPDAGVRAAAKAAMLAIDEAVAED